MKRKSILFLLLMALMAPWAANAQVQIGNGESTNNYLPSYSLYNYSVTQQIYTADEIDASGNITSIAFYNGGTAKARKYNIYMAHTTKTAFDGTSDWIDLTNNLVYEGTTAVNMTAGAWTTFTLDTPFAYNGTDNLVVGVLDLTGSWESGMSCRVFNATGNQAIYKYQDAGAYGINGTYNGSVETGTLLTLKNQIILGGIQQAYPTPMDLACTGVTANSATLNWTEVGTATSWQICLNNDETNLITANTNPFTLTGLTEEQVYTAKVRSCYDGNHYSSWSEATSFTPTAKFVIGSGTSTNSYLPTYIYYLNSLTQQIYTASELGEAGAILSIDFYCTANNTYARNFDIYMVSTSKNSFENTTDWITVTTGDLVYSGEVTLTAGWNTFELDNPFVYDGTSNVAIIVDASAEDYESGISFYVYDAPSNNQAIRVYSDGTNYDPFAPSSYTGTQMSVKNQIRILKGEGPTCPKPKNLAVSNVTNHTADLSWTAGGDETAWQICLNGDERNPIDVTTTSYTLTGLTAETTHYVKVRANCGSDDDSDWTTEISFTTDIACPAPTNLTVNLTPNSATMAWNGSADEYEMEYAVLGSGASGTFTYEFEEDLQGWTNIIVNEDQGEWLHSSAQPYGYDYTAHAHGGTGFAMCYSFIDYTGSYETDAYLVSPNAYQINAGASLNFWYDMANDSYPEYFEVCVATAANPTASDFTAIWTWSEDKAMRDPSRKVLMNRSNMRHINRTRYDNWREVTVDLSAYVGQTIWIALHDVNYDMYEVWIDDVTVDAGTSSGIEWIPVGTVTSPYTLEELDPETFYMVRVRSVCGGEDGESAWTTTTFTTPSMCDAPTNLSVTNLMPTTATLNWSGYQDGFEIRYRVSKVAHFEEDFENGIPSTWTTINNDTTNLNDWLALSDLMNVYSYYTSIPEWAHSGSNAAMSPSYANGVGAFATDQYLVTPKIDLQGTLQFYAASTYSDEFEVLLSTTGNTISDFTTTLRPMTAVSTTTGWDEISIDMSAYAGQQGYIAIHHVFTDGYFLIIDDFGLYDFASDDDWITVTTDGQSVDIEDLDPETEYEWQVRGEHRGCTNGEEVNYTPWSEMGTFTTPGLCDNPNTFTFETLEATTATLNWIGYQESYNVLYRTAEVGVMLWEDFSNGASGWTASDLNEQSSIYTLGSGEDTWKAFGFVGDGTTQYLISPELESSDAIDDSLYFFYYAYQGSTQTFKVGFSETYSLDGFTWGDEITTSSSDYNGYYEGVIPAGTKYFAIQSSGESSYLFVTDFYAVDYTNYVAPGEWVELTVNEPSVTMQPLTPNTVYDVYVQGICGEGEDDVTDWMGGYFITPELTNLTQTIELAEGSNWISFYVETDLDALKAALEEVYAGTNMTIRGMNGYTSYNGTRWRGPLTSLDMSQMYMIEVAEVGRIVVEGEPLNPADLAITINEGANWIGFPFSESMAIQNAFEGFATNGDILRSQDGYTTYNGTRWRGNISILVPGQGYIYNSTTNKDDFYYPTNTSKAGQTTLQLKPFAKNRFEKKSFVPSNIMPISK